jgi:anti-sigma B factor antagonist
LHAQRSSHRHGVDGETQHDFIIQMTQEQMTQEEVSLPKAEFQVTRDSDSVIVAIVGEFDLAAEPAFITMLDGLSADGGGDVTLDLSETSFFDSTALRCVILADLRLAALGRAMRIAAPSPRVMKVLEITGVGDQIHIDRGPQSPTEGG